MNAYELPKSVVIDETEYKITQGGDFRVILDCFAALSDIELSIQERLIACLLIFYEDFDTVEDIFAQGDQLEDLIANMYIFFNCGAVKTDDSEDSSNSHRYKLIDWEKDAQLICSAVNKVACTEIRALEYLHWWTFMAYYMAIDHSLLNIIATIRDKMLRGKQLEKSERQFRQENPQYFNWNHKTVEEQEAEVWVHEVWNKE